MSDATHNQSAAVAACTIDAVHRRDHHHGDNGACRPPTSSWSSTWADERSRSATTVVATQASFPSARLTAWHAPTAKKPTGTSTPSSLHGWRKPTPQLRSATSARVGQAAAAVQRFLADSRFGEDLPGG